MTAARPGDRAVALVLAWQDELTALGLLPAPEGTRRRPGPRATVCPVPYAPRERELRRQARERRTA